ncbi:hypothetical protein RFI_14901 [Reticulomyxa filosa]|uniref:Uncharacterized protein n=1 Tax=Reticulomyxa filosa TaxID=46433 RepID=X6NAF6_RETFI|nr:hypothetical protein RFI_14901 [Reticulomyxa filosa]|eukprot:ETO22297.1 hypothetical protein RFI_14901 [Reticulomyxa filosa]
MLEKRSSSQMIREEDPKTEMTASHKPEEENKVAQRIKRLFGKPGLASRDDSKSHVNVVANGRNGNKDDNADHEIKEEDVKRPVKLNTPHTVSITQIKDHNKPGKFGWCIVCGLPANKRFRVLVRMQSKKFGVCTGMATEPLYEKRDNRKVKHGIQGSVANERWAFTVSRIVPRVTENIARGLAS